MRLTDVNISILADTDIPADWEREDILEFSQEAARHILNLEAALRMIAMGTCGDTSNDREVAAEALRWRPR